MTAIGAGRTGPLDPTRSAKIGSRHPRYVSSLLSALEPIKHVFKTTVLVSQFLDEESF